MIGFLGRLFYILFICLISPPPHPSIMFTSTGAVVQLNVVAAVFNISTSAAVFPGRPDRMERTRDVSAPRMETLGVEFSRWRGASWQDKNPFKNLPLSFSAAAN